MDMGMGGRGFGAGAGKKEVSKVELCAWFTKAKVVQHLLAAFAKADGTSSAVGKVDTKNKDKKATGLRPKGRKSEKKGQRGV